MLGGSGGRTGVRTGVRADSVCVEIFALFFSVSLFFFDSPCHQTRIRALRQGSRPVLADPLHGIGQAMLWLHWALMQ